MRLTQSIFPLLLVAGFSCCLTAAKAGPRLDSNGDPLPPGAVARLGCARFRVGEAVESVALSPDGKMAASLGSTSAWSTVCLWDTATGRLIHRFPPRDLGGALAFSADGKHLLRVRGRSEVQLWDVAARKMVGRFSGDASEWFCCVRFSPDGSLVAAAGTKGACLWERATGKLRHRLGREGTFCALAFSDDGKTLASSAKDHAICLWEPATGKLLQRCGGHSDTIHALAFSADGKTLASAGADGKVCLWKAATGKLLRRVSLPQKRARPLAFSPDGKLLVVGGDRAVDLYDAATCKKVSSRRGHQGNVYGACFSRDGRQLLSGSIDGTLRLWALDSEAPPGPEAGHARDVMALAFSPDGRTLASGGHDGTVRLWDTRTSRQLRVRTDYGRAVTSLSFNPDGRLLVAAGNDGSEVRGYEVTSERGLRCAWQHGCSSEQAALSPDGKTVATATRSGIALRDARSGKELRCWDTEHTLTVCYSADGKTLASAGLDDAVRFWEVASGRQVQVRPGQWEWLDRLASCPDGKTWAGVDRCGLLEVWDAASGRRLCRLWDVHGCSFSPDGLLLVTVGEGGRLGLYEVATGKEVLGWQGHGDLDLRAVAFSPDGSLFASGSQDGTILLWDLDLVLHGRKPLPDRLSERDLESLWRALAGSDLRQAYRAIGILAAAPEQAIPFLRQRLHPAKMDKERVGRLLADLDSDEYAVREKAARRLAELGEVIEPLLRQALASQPSPEVRRRVERLLEGIKQQVWTAEQLRQLRCLAVLERAGTPAARQLLHELAQGAEGARLTQAARASLRRLDARGAANPVSPRP